MFARLDFSTFLICYSGDLSGNKSEEKASVAICGGLSHNLPKIDWPCEIQTRPHLPGTLMKMYLLQKLSQLHQPVSLMGWVWYKG